MSMSPDSQMNLSQIADLGIVQFFQDGGFFMWPILMVSFLATAIGLERYLALRVRYRMDGKRFFNDVKRYVTANDWRRAQEVCRQHPHNPLAQVLGAGLSHADLETEEMETAMESQALFYIPKINARIEYLSVLANIATLLGLLGTISGLIAAFSVVGGADVGAAVSKEEALASGISIAMYTTAFGLIVAIPALLAHMYLSNLANSLIDDIEHYATSLKQLIQRIKAKTTIPSFDIDVSEESAPAKTGAFHRTVESQKA